MQCRSNGTCHCRQGFVGYKCDKCEMNYFHNRATHQCEECSVCYGLVMKQVGRCILVTGTVRLCEEIKNITVRLNRKVGVRGRRGETFKNSNICAVMRNNSLYICDKITELNKAKMNIVKISAYITISYHVITDKHHRNVQLRHHEKGNETTRRHFQAENSQPKRKFSPQIQTV